MYLELDGRGELYGQLARALRRSIQVGGIPAGRRLPATRALAHDLGLSRNTVVTAYEMLHAEQLLVTRAGAGTFVAPGATAMPDRPARRGSPSLPLARVAAPSRYSARVRELPPLPLRRTLRRLRFDLQYGEPLVDLRLTTSWRRALGRALGRCDLRYSPSAGQRELRQAIREHVARRRGIACTADDVLVTSGAQQALSLAARVLLDEGDAVAIEDPGYPLADRLLRAHGARVRPVPVNASGIEVGRLPASGLRAVLVTPSHQFPSGVVMSIDTRRRLLDRAHRQGFWIIEDDYDGEFRHAGAAMPALRSLDAGGRVLYVGSFSKVLFPALRLGFLICPPGLRVDLIAAKQLEDIGCPAVEQLALAEFMAGGAFERHLRRAAIELKRRRAAALAGLREACGAHVEVQAPDAGMHVVAWLPRWSEARVQALVRLAQDRGLGVQSIGPYFRSRSARAGLLLGYAGLSAKQLKSATALLARCLEDTPRG